MKDVCPKLVGRVLDVGCGRSPWMNYVNHTLYVRLDISIEFSPDVVGDALTLPFPSEVFDSVLASEVLEHVKLPTILIGEIARMLKPNGLIVLTAPMSWCLHCEPNDYYRFTKYSLKTLLEEHGFTVVTIVRVGGFLSLIVQRFIDVIYEVMRRMLTWAPIRVRDFLPLIILAPIQVVGYHLSKVLDKVDQRDALGWGVMAYKPH